MSEVSPTITKPHPRARLDQECQPCPGCKLPLPVRAKRHGEVFAHWECAACRSPLTGILVRDITPKMAEAVRLSQIHFDTRGVEPMPESMRELLKEFIALRQQSQTHDERRAERRLPQQLDVAVVPVFENWTPRGQPLWGTVVDLTSNGLGMVTTSLGGVGHVALQIRHPSGLVQLLGRIAWTKELGPGFQDSGVQFLLRFGRTPIAVDHKPS